MAYRMTLGHQRMGLGMGLHQRDATRSSTHSVVLTESDSETGHDRSMRKSVRSSTKESRFTTH
jgi:hypothetical protein